MSDASACTADRAAGDLPPPELDRLADGGLAADDQPRRVLELGCEFLKACAVGEPAPFAVDRLLAFAGPFEEHDRDRLVGARPDRLQELGTAERVSVPLQLRLIVVR